MHAIVLLAGLITVVNLGVLAAHWPALSAQALSFDDDQYLTENRLVQDPSWSSAGRFLTEVLEPSTVGGYYQPLAMISLMLDQAAGGSADNLGVFHRTSLAIHVCNTSLVIVLLYVLFGQPWVSAMVGLLFGVHPMTVEPIPWVGERKTLLAAFFALWCLIFYVRYARTASWKAYAVCLVMYVSALLSKPTTTMLPVCMLLMDWWPLGRLGRRAVMEKIPFFVIGGVSAVVTIISQQRTAVATMPYEHSAARILLAFCHNTIFYLFTMLWPMNLTPFYDFPQPFRLSNPGLLAGVIGTCVLVLGLGVSLRWTRAFVAGWLFFLAAIFPTMGAIGFTIVIASDKYAYLPCVGLMLCLAWLVAHVWRSEMPWERVGGRRLVILMVVLFLAGAEMIGTRHYLRFWQDSETLYGRMLAFAPNAARVHNNLGVVLYAKGKLDAAAAHFRRSIEIAPYDVMAFYNLANVFKDKNEPDEAIRQYRQALQIKPDNAESHFNLGSELQGMGETDEAISHYRRAIELRADYAEAHNNLAGALMSKGQFEEAVNHYGQAISIRPDYSAAHANLGIALRMAGRLDEAIVCFREALRLQPDHPQALTNLAWILATHPDAKVRDPEEVVHMAEHAPPLAGASRLRFLDALAAAYAAMGRFYLAVSVAQQAYDLASAAKAEKPAHGIRKRLELYKQGKPYRESLPLHDTAVH